MTTISRFIVLSLCSTLWMLQFLSLWGLLQGCFVVFWLTIRIPGFFFFFSALFSCENWLKSVELYQPIRYPSSKLLLLRSHNVHELEYLYLNAKSHPGTFLWLSLLTLTMAQISVCPLTPQRFNTNQLELMVAAVHESSKWTKPNVLFSLFQLVLSKPSFLRSFWPPFLFGRLTNQSVNPQRNQYCLFPLPFCTHWPWLVYVWIANNKHKTMSPFQSLIPSSLSLPLFLPSSLPQ